MILLKYSLGFLSNEAALLGLYASLPIDIFHVRTQFPVLLFGRRKMQYAAFSCDHHIELLTEFKTVLVYIAILCLENLGGGMLNEYEQAYRKEQVGGGGGSPRVQRDK